MTIEKTSFEFETILLQSDRLDKPVELNRIVSDLEIFEHLEKPYLTARMLLVDDSNLYQNVDFVGSEKVFIQIRTSEDGAKAISKTFIISKIEKIDKIQDNAQSILIHLIEDIFYLSSLKNVNRYYIGRSKEIITKIAKNFLDHDVNFVGTEKQNFELIIPNMHPLDAMKWVTSKSFTTRGYPFYLFSTLVGNELQCQDLGTLLLNPALNSGRGDPDFIVSSVKSQDTMNVLQQRRIIENHEFNVQENLLEIIRKGLTGARYEYIDTLAENTKAFKFDVVEDLYKKLLLDGILSSEQPNPSYSGEELFEDKPIHKFSNKRITQIGGSMAFRDEDVEEEGDDPAEYTNYLNSYNEDKTAAEYKLNVVKASMESALKKNPVTFNINGLEFVKGDFHKTIGTNINVSFQETKDSIDKDEDKKKSGKYLIYSVRHMFKKTVDKYDVSMRCIKISNLRKPV